MTPGVSLGSCGCGRWHHPASWASFSGGPLGVLLQRPLARASSSRPSGEPRVGFEALPSGRAQSLSRTHLFSPKYCPSDELKGSCLRTLVTSVKSLHTRGALLLCVLSCLPAEGRDQAMCVLQGAGILEALFCPAHHTHTLREAWKMCSSVF